ncbi:MULTISPECIES: hypothetical protein [unclassified Microcoleus]|uniref:hypothetical protein n=1 Tax=unclassified Microcoleus TaxID=2642155 RepID=UPI002FD1D2BF
MTLLWLASSVAHFTVPQWFNFELDRTFKSWATPENFLFAGYMGDRQNCKSHQLS